MRVARLYRFTATHRVRGLPEPWCSPHEHAYTVEVVAERDGPGIVVDTDLLDVAWQCVRPGSDYLNAAYDDTTVEALSALWLEEFRASVPEVVQVTVWEDDSRWGQATV